MPHLQISLVPAPDQVVVRLSGDADVSTVDRLTSALQEAAELGTRRVVVDVAGVRFWDGTCLHALTRFSDAVSPTGRSCRVVGAPAATRRLVRTSGLAGRLELDGPLGGQDPVLPAGPRPTPNRSLPVPPAPAAAGSRRAVAPHEVRTARRVEDRPPRRRVRIGTLRRWR
ncbi:STAS domain-containing protein [Geodermatophilus sp. CPCC 206100]|uniref:STAS domain-containing protein n=1 Tax=Geodermatophilus sp. CPCC 206100 TaxID=3020054 RepID=UPI003AFF7EC2